MDIKPLKLQIANYQLYGLPTGLFGLDGGAMFGTVPKVLWEKKTSCGSSQSYPIGGKTSFINI